MHVCPSEEADLSRLMWVVAHGAHRSTDVLAFLLLPPRPPLEQASQEQTPIFKQALKSCRLTRVAGVTSSSS